MANLLLFLPQDTTSPRARRTRIHERVRARLCPWRLDVALARGARADARADLALRAYRLISLPTRQRLAREIHRILHDVAHPPHLVEHRLHCCIPGVIGAAALLYDLADELVHPGPVEACGVAQVRLLLRDGSGPLYDEPWPGCLEETLTRALDALTPAGALC